MSKKPTKQSELTPKDRFGPVYLAYRANTPGALWADVQALIKSKNQLLDECQRDFIFQLIWESRELQYHKFLFFYKAAMAAIGLDLPKERLVQMMVSKLSVLGRQHTGYEYDAQQFTSDADDVNFSLQLDGHDKLLLRDVLFANECMLQLPNIGRAEETPVKDAKKQAKKFAFILSPEEQQRILEQFLRICRSLSLYRLAFDESFVQEMIFSTEKVSAVHLPMLKQLEPLAASVVFKEKTALEMKVLSVLKPLAHQLHKEIVAQAAESAKK